jgi:DNA-binding NtrC family response regulator
MSGDQPVSEKMRAAETAAARVPTSDVPGSGDGPLTPARILIIEDEEQLGRALVRFLRSYDVVYCTTAAEALERVRAGEHFDVVVSDMMMPGGNGSDLYAVLLAEAPDLASRSLFMTGGATTPDTVAFVAEHAANVLQKPLDLANLRKRVDAILADRRVSSRP